MSVLTTLRSVSDDGAGPWAVIGTGSMHDALGDNLDTTSIFIVPPDQNLVNVMSGKNTMAALALPAGARIEWLRWRVRMSQTNSAVYIWVGMGDGSDEPWQLARVNPDGSIYPVTLAALARDPNTGADWSMLTSPWTVYLIAGDDNGGGSGGIGVNALYLDASYRRQGTCRITGPADGTTVATARPTFTWAASAPDTSTPQELYTVRVYDAATFSRPGFDPMNQSVYKAIWDSGVIRSSSARSATPKKALPSGEYRVYVWVSQPWSGTQGEWWSPTVYNHFFINQPVPVPSIAAVADHDAALVHLQLHDTTDPTTGWMAAAAVASMVYEAQRSDDGGITWVDVRQHDTWIVPTADQHFEGPDYEAPFHTKVLYRARQTVTLIDGSSGTSHWSAVVPTVLRTQEWWLKDPTDPNRNRVVNVAAFTRSTQEAQGVFEPLGRKTALVISDGTKADRGELTIRTRDPDEKAAVTKLVADNRVCLLQHVLGDQWYVRFGQERKWTIVRAQPLDTEWTPIRSFHEVALPWVTVDAPET